MKKFIHGLTAFLSVLLSVMFTLCGICDYLSPGELKTNALNCWSIKGPVPMSLRCDDAAVNTQADCFSPYHTKATLLMFDTIPVKEVNISLEERKYVVPGGTPFGIRLYTEGLVISYTSPVKSEGREYDPSANAGLQAGDVILSVNEKNLASNEQLLNAVEESGGKSLRIKASRNGRIFFTSLTPVYDSEVGRLRAGLYVRDSCAGIGTLTYTDPENQSFAGLGHGICDGESGCLMPLLSGDIVKANIVGVRKSVCGTPGTLSGRFSSDESIGSLIMNSEHGVYGKFNSVNSLSEKIPVAFKQEVVKGSAQILTTVSGDKPEAYNVEIEEISYNNLSNTKNMVIRISDDRLFSKTGGIVQGMSGSPVIQNGALVGAITHVFVNDPSRGYAVFAENMMNFSNKIPQTNQINN